MKAIKSFTVFTLFMGTVFIIMSCEKEELESHILTKNYELNFEPALTNNEYDLLARNPKVNMIRSFEQFDQVVKEELTPLRKVSPEKISEFRETLVFRENRLVGLGYGPIKNSVSNKELNQVLAIFGIDTKDGFWGLRSSASVQNMQVAGIESDYIDYKEYQCISKGTCYENSDHICLSGC